MNTPPRTNSKGNLLSLSKLYADKAVPAIKSLVNNYDLQFQRYLFYACSAIIKQGITANGIYANIVSYALSLIKYRVATKQFIVSIPIRVQITDLPRIIFPRSMINTMRKYIPEYWYLCDCQCDACIEQNTKAVDTNINVQLEMTAQSRLFVFQLSNLSLMFPQQSYTQILTIDNDNTERIQRIPVQQSQILKYHIAINPNI